MAIPWNNVLRLVFILTAGFFFPELVLRPKISWQAHQDNNWKCLSPGRKTKVSCVYPESQETSVFGHPSLRSKPQRWIPELRFGYPPLRKCLNRSGRNSKSFSKVYGKSIFIQCGCWEELWISLYGCQTPAQHWIKILPPWVQEFYPVLGLGSGGKRLRHFQTPTLHWIHVSLRV